MDSELLQCFIEQVNDNRSCVTAGCKGKWVPVSVISKALGGPPSVTYICDGCKLKGACFDTSYVCGNISEISKAVQVVFIVSGCTHTTYYKALHHILGIEVVRLAAFLNTIKMMYPVVKTMVDEMCEEAMEEMQQMDQKVLGS